MLRPNVFPAVIFEKRVLRTEMMVERYRTSDIVRFGEVIGVIALHVLKVKF